MSNNNGLLDTYLLSQALGWNWDLGTMIILGFLLPVLLVGLILLGYLVVKVYLE